ncbi:hypothetical protein DOTSEDRAFT_73784 [Dothistroma septosporum NZE10]|uniref:Zn(2)-C6 fungal-type domain-containing protein n=1 Tax=Dothistroma septosporum (strain NZE10 / CBS 128990) TaxID=675120 RepID=N1PIV9_DOTSN|nr:hypothetical protein DOTSEDRAFT_73784 [Dothistroma septosporum NZE10]
MTEDGNETPVERTQSLNVHGKRSVEATSSSAAKKADKAKRVRVSRACDQCRAGREKCDGAQPICHTCETQSRACTYNEQPKKRGIQPNYIRTLELTLAWILQHFPDSEARLSQLLPKTDEQPHRLISFKDAAAAEALHTAWRNGIISRQIEQLLSGNDIESPQAAGSSQVNNTAYRSPPLSVPSDTAAILSEQNQSGTTGDADVLYAGQSRSSELTAHETLVLPHNSWKLLEHYFTFTQTWVPIIEKHDIMRLMYSYPSHGLSSEDARAAKHAELWSIMAWSAFSIGTHSGTSFEMCHSVAKSLIPAGDGIQLGHVKALLILGIIEIARDSFLAAWLTIGSAVRVLTHYQGGNGLEAGLGGTRTKHTVLAAFLLEQVVALHSGANGHLKHRDVEALGLLVEDGLEEWEPWTDPTAGSSSGSAKAPARSISTFNSLVRLALQVAVSENSAVLSPKSPSDLSVVSGLLRNASIGSERLHPVAILNTQHPDAPSFRETPGSIVRQTDPVPVQHHARTISTHEDWTPGVNTIGDTYMDQQYPFMSIPNESTEILAGYSAGPTTNPRGMPVPWSADNMAASADNTFDFNVDSINDAVASGGDIFEELAMLERADSTHNPKFMQNLGFGPDLDLAEFFGADYQPSDPLLAYMQPETFGDLPHDLDSNTDGGV